ncbi:MAG: phosphate acetyltransferase [Geminicoccaceae bacterium]
MTSDEVDPAIIEKITATSRATSPRIVLSEGEDIRVVKAALQAAREGVADISVVADRDTFQRLAGDAEGRDLVTVHDPRRSDRLEAYVETYFQLRQHKGITRDAALAAMRGNLGFAAMMVREGDADGTIGGAVATTADTVRTALQIIGRAPDVQIVSSFFLMLLPRPEPRPVVFADCALVITPSAEELASIAISSAASFEAMTGQTARVAMLSFSTNGSAKHESIDRINEAVSLARTAAPDLILEGEIQFDAAIDREIRNAKAPDSLLEDAANVFIFPNLDSGNIGYKIAQRIGGAAAIGPVLQGLAKPANDLSRGCSIDDIRQLIAITGAQVVAARTPPPD